MRFLVLTAASLLGAALVLPSPASAWGGCRCMMMMQHAPASGSMPGMSMPQHNHAPAPAHQGHQGAGPNGHAKPAGETALVALSISSMTWPVNCPPRVRKALASLPWVRQVQVDYGRKLAVVTADAAKCDEKALLKALEQAGFGGRVLK